MKVMGRRSRVALLSLGLLALCQLAECADDDSEDEEDWSTGFAKKKPAKPVEPAAERVEAERKWVGNPRATRPQTPVEFVVAYPYEFCALAFLVAYLVRAWFGSSSNNSLVQAWFNAMEPNWAEE